MTADFIAPLMQALVAGVGIVFTTLVGIYVPRALAAFERRTGVAVTDQERAAVLSAVTTAAGLLQTRLDLGQLRIQDITPTSSAVVGEANAALGRVPNSAAAQGTSLATTAAMIVARVDTSAPPGRPPPSPVPAIPRFPAA